MTDDDDRHAKALERKMSDHENAIATAKEAIATLEEEIASLTAGIKALDKSVAEATEQRKEENTEYKDPERSGASRSSDMQPGPRGRVSDVF